MNLESIKEFFSGFDTLPTLPDPGPLVEKADVIARLLVMAGPVVMIIMGLLYLLAAPQEANHHFGYRCYFGMGSEQAWRYTQRIAGYTWAGLGVVLTVAMLLVTAKFAQQDLLEVLTTAVVCVVVEALVLLLASIVIRTIVAARYDRHGERRRRK